MHRMGFLTTRPHPDAGGHAVKAKPKGFYRNSEIEAFFHDASHIEVVVHLPAGDLFGRALHAVAGETVMVTEKLEETFRRAVQDVFETSLHGRMEDFLRAYALYLKESMAKGDDPEVKAALNKVRVQQKILSRTPVVDQGEACELLSLSTSNPSATMLRKEKRREILRFTVDGRAVYPLFQFDIENRKLYPAMKTLLDMTPETWSNYRVLHWLTRSHADLGGAPAEHLGTAPEAVIGAYAREIEPSVHG